MNAQPITLTALQYSIKSSLSERFPLPIWVSAEISELKVNYSGHCYIELIEKGEKDGIARAQARAVIWRNSYATLSTLFLSETGQRLGAGLKVLVKVLVNFHELYGLSLQITDIDPAYTLGESERERLATIAQLKSEGVWELNKEQILPMLTQRIAIVSSRNAAGYQDFSREVEASGYHLSLTLYDAFMQGAGAEESIVAALEAIADEQEMYDAVVVIRGGGSASDLNCFNSYRLSSHIAQFPLPVVAGIGHDKDISVVDMVAHTSLKTPTAVATWLVERLANIENYLATAALTLHDAAATTTHSAEIALEKYTTYLAQTSKQLIDSKRTALENIASLLPERCAQLLSQERSKIGALESNVTMHSPEHLLRLGFAIVSQDGATLSSVNQADKGSQILITLHDGEITTEITEINKK